MSCARRITAGLLMAIGVGVLAVGAAVADEALEKLVRELGNRRTSAAAHRALIARLDRAALPLLRNALPDYDRIGQYYGVRVLDRYPAAQTKRTWRALLECDAPYLRFCAGQALHSAGDDKALEVAVTILTDAKTVPAMKASMLARVNAQSPARMLDGLRILLEPGQDLRVLTTTLAIVHSRRDPEALQNVERLLEDPRRGVKAMAAAFLYERGQIERARILAEALKQGVTTQEFAAVQNMLPANRRVAEEILGAVAEHLKVEEDPRRLVQQMALLQKHGYAGACDTLKAFLAHPNADVARKAFDVLVALGGPARKDTFGTLLSGDDMGRRLWAAEALRQGGDTSGIDAAILVLEKGKVGEREDAARVLSGFTMDLAVEPLLGALADDHEEVRAAAFAGLQKLLPRLYPYRPLDLSSTGYAAKAPAAKRSAGAQRIRQWWARNRKADW